MLSIPHLIIIFVIVLIAVGPEKMPQLARTLGKAMAEFRKITGDLRRVVDDEMRELDRQTREAEIRKHDAAAQASLPAAVTPAVPVLTGALPDEHVIAPPELGISPQPDASIAPPGTIPTAAPNGRVPDAASVATESTVPENASLNPAQAEPSPDAESKSN